MTKAESPARPVSRRRRFDVPKPCVEPIDRSASQQAADSLATNIFGRQAHIEMTPFGRRTERSPVPTWGALRGGTFHDKGRPRESRSAARVVTQFSSAG